MAEKKKTVEEYVAALPAHQQAIVRELRQLIRSAAPDAKESIKWAQPVYEVNGPFAYIKAFTNHVNFGFWRGAQLTDPDQLLMTGGTHMAHIKLKEMSDIKSQVFTLLVTEAVKLNHELGDPTKSTRGKQSP